MSGDYEIFKGKTLSGLFEDIYNNQINKKQKISELIRDIKKLAKSPMAMSAVGPVLKDLIDTSVKNDELLIKMATIVQRLISAEGKYEDDNGFLSEKEKEELMNNFNENISKLETEVKNEIESVDDVQIDKLKKKVEKINGMSKK